VPAVAVDVRNLSRSFGTGTRRRVLQDVSLRVAPGDYVAIMGESGAGKSTLLNLIAGLDQPDSGSVSIEGIDLGGLDENARTLLRRRRMGFVFQAFHLLPYLSVARNVALPLALNGIGGGAAAVRVGEILAAVGLADRADSSPAELSGGEMQRVAIARALAHRPGVLLADEPTGNLDPEIATTVLALLRDQVKRDGAAGILVTHSSVAAATADRVYELAGGRLHLKDVTSRTAGEVTRPHR
jgi:putative ABC transport system ATP-binding protein